MHELSCTATDGCPLYASTAGSGPTVALLHGGGPDRHSLLPLATTLLESHRVLVPDIRGYGMSRCPHPSMHTWAQYTRDLRELCRSTGASTVSLIGTGLGATLALRLAREEPDLVTCAVLISVEDIEDDAGKRAEQDLMDRFADVINADGLEAAWELFLPDLQPLIGNLVRDALPRADAASSAAASRIGHDRAFTDLTELSSLQAPCLIVAGDDWRHPEHVGVALADVIPHAELASVRLTEDVATASALAQTLSPLIKTFLSKHAPPAV